jgi:hypothetical protein
MSVLLRVLLLLTRAAEPTPPPDAHATGPREGVLRCPENAVAGEAPSKARLVLSWVTSSGPGNSESFAVFEDGIVGYTRVVVGEEINCTGRIVPESLSALRASLEARPLARFCKRGRRVDVDGEKGSVLLTVAFNEESRCRIALPGPRWRALPDAKGAREALERFRRQVCGTKCPDARPHLVPN